MKELDAMIQLLIGLGFNSYEAKLITYLLYLGEATALKLSELSGVPTSKTYIILKELKMRGIVIERPGRPSFYSCIPPSDILNKVIEYERRKFDSKIRRIKEIGSEMEEIADTLFRKGLYRGKRMPLVRIIKVGSVSEDVTRKMYRSAKKEILILTQAFEYYPRVKDSLINAIKRNIIVKIIFRDPRYLSSGQRSIQRKIIEAIKKDCGNRVGLRFSKEVPLRGCIIDPEGDGSALFLVEEKEVPFEYREAAVTENRGLLKSLALVFNLLWKASNNHQ